MSLTQAPILTYPDPSAMFILDTDASGTGIGAVLSQVSSPEHCSDPEQERVVAGLLDDENSRATVEQSDQF